MWDPALKMRVEALMPKCCICSNDFQDPNFQLHQLVCRHVFCQHCLQYQQTGNGFFCPLEGAEYVQIDQNAVSQAAFKANYYLNNGTPADVEICCELLEQSFSHSQIPCIQFFKYGACPNPMFCKCDHTNPQYQYYPCPLGIDCWRKDMCLFLHNHTESVIVSVKSRSLFVYIQNHGGKFAYIMNRYQAQLSNMQQSEPSNTIVQKWVFEQSGSENPIVFEEEAEKGISYAASHQRHQVSVADFKVYFNPACAVFPNGNMVRTINTSICIGTSSAGEVTLSCPQNWGQSLSSEIQKLEIEAPSVPIIGQKRIRWCEQFGLAVYNGAVIGTEEDLRSALNVKPPFDEYEDIVQFPIQPGRVLDTSGRPIISLPTSIIGRREDIDYVSQVPSLISNDRFPTYSLALSPLPSSPNPAIHRRSSTPVRRQQTLPPAVQRNLRVNPPPMRPMWMSQNCAMFSMVAQTDPDFQKVRSLLTASLQSARVVSIQRVQNKPAYTRFEQKLEALRKAAGRQVDTMDLFHATKEEPPDQICADNRCLNTRNRKSKWGVATYFYESAEAVDKYAHQARDGRQTLLCEVITGNSFRSPPNYFPRPPIDPATNSPCHSVQGFQFRSRMWAVYEEDMAYPKFIVTYDE